MTPPTTIPEMEEYTRQLNGLVDRIQAFKIPRAYGPFLDQLGQIVGVERRRWLYVFKEWDYFYRKRLHAALR